MTLVRGIDISFRKKHARETGGKEGGKSGLERAL
jgi:hypothetical protein